MVGPSSSHTAGAIAIGALARQLFGGTPKNVRCDYYESFSETHKDTGRILRLLAESWALRQTMSACHVPLRLPGPKECILNLLNEKNQAL